MATQNGVNTSLAGQTGSGAFVGANSPTLITPNLGVATATSLAFSPTTNGILGTTTNNNASAGYVGELILSKVLNASAVSVAMGVATNVTSINLTAGDWDVWGNVFFNIGGVCTVVSGWINSTSATLPDLSLVTNLSFTAIGPDAGFGVPDQPFQLAAPATIYLSVLSQFSTSTVTASGGIYARRIR